MSLQSTKGFRYPQYTDTPDVPRDLQYLAYDIDAYLNTNKGAQGIQGVQGFQGLQGGGFNQAQGVQGIQGPAIQGIQGLQGPAGTIQGIQGLQGGGFNQAQGVQGIQGIQGFQGFQGIQGLQGISIQGTQGIQGRQGIQGFQGIQGLQGISVQGIQGRQGTTGVQGAIGTTIFPDILPVDTIVNDFDGKSTRFPLLYQGNIISNPNPFRLIIHINGIPQPVNLPDYTWDPILPTEGFYIDSDGYIQFQEAIPAGATFDGRLINGPTVTSITGNYPFHPQDILMGGYN